jgi:hypothetical protein
MRVIAGSLNPTKIEGIEVGSGMVEAKELRMALILLIDSELYDL